MRRHTRMIWLAALIALGGVGGLNGCGGPCMDFPTEVGMYADTYSGDSPLTVSFIADGEGRSCGCCGSDGSSVIVMYDWDFDGDGIIDLSGEDLTEVTHTYDATGEYTARVVVTDSRSDTAEDEVTIIVE